MTIYTLTIEGQPLSTTQSLDHATAWKLKGSEYNYLEVPHYESADLACYTENNRILIKTDETIAEVKPNWYNEDSHVFTGTIDVDFFTSTKRLEKCNFTIDLILEIEYEIDQMRERKQNEAGSMEIFEDKLGYDYN